MNGVAYTYGDQPHAVTSVGNANYIYDDNGNMTDRDGQGITWDVENRPTTIDSETYVYDGDGNRIMKTVSGVTTLYINKYYEKKTSTGTITVSYYLGDRLVALKEGETLKYIHQDSLSSSSVMSDSVGQAISTVTYFPFGATRTGSIDTEKQFTGQRHDDTGLYYYGARYYDPTIGRFISADTVVQPTVQSGAKVIDALTISFSGIQAASTQGTDANQIKYINSQALNRYSYVLNNPLKYTDPSGHMPFWLVLIGVATIIGALAGIVGYCVELMITGADDMTVEGLVHAAAVGGLTAGFTTALIEVGVNPILAGTFASLGINIIANNIMEEQTSLTDVLMIAGIAATIGAFAPWLVKFLNQFIKGFYIDPETFEVIEIATGNVIENVEEGIYDGVTD
jgi:RHS repeat-associated protein